MCHRPGWHAKRFEFEPEWDNDAEASIAEIEFKETDTPEEEAAKLRLLEIYNKRLDEVGFVPVLVRFREQYDTWMCMQNCWQASNASN